MSDTRSIQEKIADNGLIEEALRQAVRDALLAHARAGKPVCTSRDGQVVWLQPEEVFRMLNETSVNGHAAPSQPSE